jgi:hypothetical protein
MTKDFGEMSMDELMNHFMGHPYVNKKVSWTWPGTSAVDTGLVMTRPVSLSMAAEQRR